VSESASRRPLATRLRTLGRRATLRPADRVLVSGWFSMKYGGATAGDVEAHGVVCEWLDELGMPYDLALGAPFEGGVDWRRARPSRYTHLVLVCGPVWKGSALEPLLERFHSCRRVGVNLSVLTPLAEWNPFDVLLARDGLGDERVDLSIVRKVHLSPLVGVLRVHEQREYGDLARTTEAGAALDRLLGASQVVPVEIDTLLQTKDGRALARAEGDVEALIARMDAVVTMRMHGLVLALKNGVPAVAIDPIEGGAKIAAQARALAWPHVHVAGDLHGERLASSLRACLEPSARVLATRCANAGRASVGTLKDEFVQALG